MAKQIGQIAVNLSANSAAFNRDLNKARENVRSSTARMNRSLSTLERSFGKVKRSAANTIRGFTSMNAIMGTLAGTAGLGLLVKKSLETADAIGKTADKLGLSTTALQEYQFAASQSGVKTETLNMALQRFTRRVAEAAQGKGELRGVLEQYNIAALNSAGRTRDVNAVLNDLADTIKNTDSRAERLRIAFKAFDSEGAALVNMLKNGRTGMDAFRAEAERLGIVLDEVGIRKAERASDELDKFSKVVKNTFTQAVINNADALARSFEKLANLTGRIAQAFAGPSEMDQAISRFDEIRQRIAEIENSNAPGKEGMLRGLNSALDRAQKKMEHLFQTWDRANSVWNPPSNDDSGGGSETVDDKNISKIIRDAGRMQKDFWRIQAEDRHEVTSRMYDVLIEQEREYIEEAEKLGKDMWLIKSEDMERISEAADDAGSKVSNSLTNAFDIASSSLSSFLVDGQRKFSDFADSLIRDLLRMQIQMSLTNLFNGAAGGLLSNLTGMFSGGGAAAGPIHKGAGGTTAFGMADGGYLGEGVVGIGRSSGASYEFHPNEFVIPAANIGGGGGVSSTEVIVNNNSGIPATVREQPDINGAKKIFVEIGNDIIRGGPVGQAIGLRYGLRPAGKVV